MQRSHSLPMSGEMVFSDTTSSCDGGHHSVTFFHTSCAAGAAPLGVFITTAQSKEAYTEAFSLLRKKFTSCFNNKGFPDLFMTDNALAEIEAICEVWPECKHLLCIFHVLQAVWRWLWDSKNSIPNEKRAEFMTMFQNILYAENKDDMTKMYQNCLIAGQELPNWVEYVNYYWQFKDKWGLCYRDFKVRGSHTNNFSESAIRVMKDIVLSRVKTYNLISLVDLVCTGFEELYITRFIDFSNFRQRQSFIFFKKCLKKTTYLSKNDIVKLDDNLFMVPSEQNFNIFYIVNTEVGSCTCPDGQFGKFCKHECAVYNYFNICSKNFPPVRAQDRELMYIIAKGKSPGIYFFENFQAEATEVSDNFAVMNSVLIDDKEVDQFEVLEEIDFVTNKKTVSSLDKNISDSIENTTKKLFNKLNQFKNSHQSYIISLLKKYDDKIDKVKTIGQMENLLLGLHKKRFKSGARINAQPTSISRRRAGLTRGSKRQKSGRPPKGESATKKQRVHNITQNVRSNMRN